MKILCCGDQHWTTRKPKNRTDFYFKSVMGKLRQEFEIAQEEGCEIILFPGDLFDSFKENHLLVQEVLYLCNEFHKIKILAVPGQHDQEFHNPNLAGTPIETLIASGAIELLTAEPQVLTLSNIAFYGAGWNAEIPEITTPDCLNVLVIHKMIIQDKLWAEQEGHTWGNHMLLKTKFDLIVSGDNHQQFIIDSKGRYLINMGSMMRSTIAQINHRPAVSVYDTNTKQVDIIDLIVAPFDEVMKIEKAMKEKEKNDQLDAFVQSLKKKIEVEDYGHGTKLNFVQKVDEYIIENEIDPDVVAILDDCLAE